MKICIANTYYYPDIVGGAEISVLKLAEQLHKDGNEVYILCTDSTEKKEIINGVNIHRIKVNNIYSPIEFYNNGKNKNIFGKIIFKTLDKYNIFNYRILKKSLNEIKPDILHINNVNGLSSIIWRIAKKLNIPIVQTLRDYSLLGTNESFKGNLRRIIYSYLMKDIDCATAPSKYSLDRFIVNNYFKTAKKRVIYNAIDFSHSDVKRALEVKREYLKSDNGKIKFIFLGRLEEEKGIELLINSFMEIKNENIELLIAGKGSYENFVKSCQEKDERIVYLGFINEEEKNKYLMESNVLIIPSLWPEPFGRVIIEAYKFAMPVIGIANGGIPEIIEDRKTGILVDPNNLDELKESMEYFSSKENILNVIDRCSEEINKYDIKTHSAEYYQLFNEVIANK